MNDELQHAEETESGLIDLIRAELQGRASLGNYPSGVCTSEYVQARHD